MIGIDAMVGASHELTPRETAALVKAGVRVVAGMTVGMILATIGLALGWKAHRVIGGVLGFVIVGPAVGGTIGWLAARGEVAAAMVADAAERKQLAAAGAPR